MKKIAILLLSFITVNSFSQKNTEYTFGELKNEDLNLKIYRPDTSANALVLYESGNTVFKFKNDKVIISTKHYKKIKIFNREGYKHASFSISLYNNKTDFESVEGIKAITHNNLNKTFLTESQIFKEQVNENWKEIKFTMPNLKEGSIVEVEYTVETPFKFNLTGWEFQSDIPKIFSLYKASIPGNYYYNRILNGYLKLKTNSSTIKKDCFRVPGYAGSANCEEVTYAMENIPAFETEEYMTDKGNFISKIKFELSEFLWFNGAKEKYTTTWDAVDKEFKTDKNIGGQFKKTKLFADKLPTEIKLLNSDLEKAKAVYIYIQNHFTWNKKFGIFRDVKVKEAFENKVGNVGEINISLTNALKAAGLSAEIVLLSTRENGFPTKLHPVITDFNYIIAKVTIDNKIYLLDATNKLAPFGLLPFKCLNGFGRAMNFENESYWIDIVPVNTSKTNLSVSLKLNDDGTFNGKYKKESYGYHALFRRETILNKSNDAIISEFESNFNNLEVLDYKIENQNDFEKPLVEIISVLIKNDDNASIHYLNPFFDEQFKENPFKQENRMYPIDFGYPKEYNVDFLLELPLNYDVKSFPESKAYTIPKNEAHFKLILKNIEGNKVTLNSAIVIDKPVFNNFEYESLKILFKNIINSQKTYLIIQKKIDPIHNKIESAFN
ncbi:MAG: transglutaminase domain-containing protein [Lutibacter sp.]